jgi:hypothetical protein
MRAILLANATVTTCLRATRLASLILSPEDCFVLCSSTVCAPRTKSFRRYLFPRLLVQSAAACLRWSVARAPLPARQQSRDPFLKAAPLPMAAIAAWRSRGPMPGIATRRQRVQVGRRCARSVGAGTASPSAVVSAVPVMHPNDVALRNVRIAGDTPMTTVRVGNLWPIIRLFGPIQVLVPCFSVP